MPTIFNWATCQLHWSNKILNEFNTVQSLVLIKLLERKLSRVDAAWKQNESGVNEKPNLELRQLTHPIDKRPKLQYRSFQKLPQSHYLLIRLNRRHPFRLTGPCFLTLLPGRCDLVSSLGYGNHDATRMAWLYRWMNWPHLSHRSERIYPISWISPRRSIRLPQIDPRSLSAGSRRYFHWWQSVVEGAKFWSRGISATGRDPPVSQENEQICPEELRKGKGN